MIGIIKIIDWIVRIIYAILIFFIIKDDIKNRKVNKLLIIYGSLFSILYMVYQSILSIRYMYLSTIYLLIYIVLVTIDTYMLQKHAKDSYAMGILTMLNLMWVFTESKILIQTIIATTVAAILYMTIKKVTRKKNIQSEVENGLPIGFFLGASNILVLLIETIM